MIRFSTQDLDGFLRVAKHVPRASLPILENVHISPLNGALHLIKSSLDFTLDMLIPGEGDADVCLSYKALHGLAGKGGEVQGDVSETSYELTRTEDITDPKTITGQFFVTTDGDHVSASDVSDYPINLDRPDGAEYASGEPSDILATLDRVLAIKKIESVVIDENSRFIITDGHRLTIVGASWLPAGVTAAVDRKLLVALQRVLKDSRAVHNVDVYLTAERLWFEAPGCLTIDIRLHKCESVHEKGAVNQEYFSGPTTDAPIWFDKQDGIEALRLVRIMTSDRNKGMEITGMLGAIKVKCSHPDLGFGQTEIPAYVPPEHVGRLFLANVDYIQDAVRACQTANVPVVVSESALHIGDHLVMLMRA